MPRWIKDDTIWKDRIGNTKYKKCSMSKKMNEINVMVLLMFKMDRFKKMFIIFGSAVNWHFQRKMDV